MGIVVYVLPCKERPQDLKEFSTTFSDEMDAFVGVVTFRATNHTMGPHADREFWSLKRLNLKYFGTGAKRVIYATAA